MILLIFCLTEQNNENNSNQDDIKQQITPFDAVLSLGAWCQVGSVIKNKSLQLIESPFNNFGFQIWENVIDILKYRFKNYWNISNLYIGQPITEHSCKYKDMRQIYQVYDSHYAGYSNHHFDVSDNSQTNLTTYTSFKTRQKLLIDVFLKQCQVMNYVCFVLKAMSTKTETQVSEKDLVRLYQILKYIRQDKPFQLRLSVPPLLYESTLEIIIKNNLLDIRLFTWTQQWNYDADSDEWKSMLQDIQLSSNHQQQIEQIIDINNLPFSTVQLYLNS
ncbi:Putative_papain-like cysteine peptidase (DUF1796) [Hexamita inflata]|uniref:Papain-like cysteine peptidase (DUF1796) n=1 Tax=Hexamita inflata TaxID=28002 RepID=A0AA86NDL8_9EUKA|nr:Putative papain-like cysteine peptidase (DUF1796) [Hexamita inflata]